MFNIYTHTYSCHMILDNNYYGSRCRHYRTCHNDTTCEEARENRVAEILLYTVLYKSLAYLSINEYRSAI